VFTKQWSLALVLSLVAIPLLSSSASALNYSNRLGNKATFETLEEARASSVAAATAAATAQGPAAPGRGRIFKSHPVLDGYPKGTAYVYRAANLFGGRAGRSNTNIVVFSDKSFESKDAALAYLKGLGVIDIIDAAIGSVVLVTPADPKAGFGAADQKSYYALQTAMLSIGASERAGDVVTAYSDATYFGTFSFLYAIGIDGGATFFNNYIATTFDFASRLGGVLLINSKIDDISQVAAVLPAWLVNATEAVQTKYSVANGTDAVRADANATTYFNQALPLQQVIVSRSAANVSAVIKAAYAEMFSKAMRIPVVKQGVYTAGTPYQGYNFDQAPYTLSARNVVTNGATPSGILVSSHQEDRFSSLKTKTGDYLQTWYEYVPSEVRDGKAAPGSVPLILALHGGGDDPQAFVEENGWLELASQKRLIMVAPEHQGLDNSGVLGDAIAALAAYMIKTYPAIDASRVYASGYSMGGIATNDISVTHPRLLAAVVNMAGAAYDFTDAMSAPFKDTDLPFMFLTSAYDSTRDIKWEDGSLTDNVQKLLNTFLGYNKMSPLKFDFTAHPKNGFQADAWSERLLSNDHKTYVWYLNKQNVPMVALSYTADQIHALCPEYAWVAWDYLSQFSRDQKTGAVVYHPHR
jgi:hypothetical protein